MASFKGNKLYVHGSGLKTGILLTNLGTPDEPTKSSLKIYLKQFLSDKRVIETPKAIWWPILNGIVLNTRPAKSAKNYKSVWTEKGSPLLYHTESQLTKIKNVISKKYKNIVFDIGMRYGNPSISKGLNNLRNQNCDRIIVLPLYPHIVRLLQDQHLMQLQKNYKIGVGYLLFVLLEAITNMSFT